MDFRIWQRMALLAAMGFLALLVILGNLLSSYRWINQPFAGFFLYDNRTVAPDFLPEWSGKTAGLKFLDRIVAVDGRGVTRRQEIYDVVRKRPVGSPIRYDVERGGRVLSLGIPTMRFTFFDWLLSYGVYLLTGLGFLAIGATPFFHRSASPSAASLFFMVSAIFFWFATSFDFMTAQTFPKELRIFAFALTPGIGIHLGLLLTRRRRGARVSRVLIYGTAIGLGGLYSSTFHGPIELWHGTVRITYLYSCLAAVIFLVLVGSALRRPGSHLERSRLRVMLVGSVLGFFLPTFGTVLASSFRWEIPYNLLLIPTVFFPLSVAFALLKYSLFDIDTVLKIGLSRGALTGALLLIYVLVVSVLSFAGGIYEQGPVVPLLFSVLVALIFNPLLGWIEGLLDRYVYRKEYDPGQLQGDVSLLLRSLSQPQVLAEKFLKILTDRIGIESPLLFLRNPEGEWYLAVSRNDGVEARKEVPGEPGSAWSRHFETHRRGISRDEVETNPVYEENRRELLGIFEKFNSELLIPILFEQKLLGLLSLGKKRSGRAYRADDFKLLSILADQLALSLKNGMLFEESERAKEKYRLLYDRSETMNKRLVEADRIKKQFVANISHELRTPISTILGYTEVLMDPGFAGNSRVILERVVNGGRDLSHLMDSLLDFSRMEAGGMTTNREEIDVRHLFRSLEMMVQRLLKGRPIRFRSEIESRLDLIETDAKQLQQILMHLLTNALKFTERGEIGLEFRVHSEGESEFVEFSVSDTGIGISRQDQEVIFEEFRQLDGSSTRQYGGTGVGLSLCRKLAHSLGGQIQVESRPGQGSTFSLILPLQRPQAMTISTVSS